MLAKQAYIGAKMINDKIKGETATAIATGFESMECAPYKCTNDLEGIDFLDVTEGAR